MNFKKYHVSKNLWDEEYPNISPTIKYVPLYVGEGSFTLSSTTPLPPNGAACLFFFSGSVDSGAGPQNRVYHENPRTVDSIDGYVTIAYRITSYDARDYTTMLNSGSTPLPYEPYSSEVWHDIPHYIHNTSTDTITTLPANIYPNDTIATVGLKGQTTQSSIPSSTSPVMPQGTGERTGNLFDKNATDTNNGYVVDGYLTSGGTINTNNDYRTSEYIPILSNQKYITYAAGLNVPSVCFYDANKNYISGVNYAGRQYAVFTTPSDAKYVRLSFKKVDKTIMFLNLGDTALSYEPYGYKIPISSANTTTPVYLGEVETTRKVKKLVLTGEENWVLEYTDNFLLNTVIDNAQPLQLVVCTHQQSISTSYEPDTNFENVRISQSKKLNLRTRTIPHNLSDFKSYLAQQYANGTPVTIWYVLANEETGIVNEPLMKIGNYADSLTTSIPCTAGENTLDVQTTVQPSEVTAGFSGWHPVTDVHEYDSNYTIATMQALTIAQLQTHTISELQGGEWS